MKLPLVATCLSIGLSFLPTDARAQAKPVKDDVVFLRVPSTILGTKVSAWSGVALTMTVEPSAEGASVQGRTDWRTAGFPSLIELRVSKLKLKPYNADPGEIELKSPSATTIKVSFPKGHVAELFSQVVATKAEVEGYRTDTYRILGEKFFEKTALASLSEDRKLALVRFAHMTANGTEMGAVTYKERLYLLVDLGDLDIVYNEIKMNQSQRIADVLNDRLLKLLKAYSSLVADVPEVYGVKLVIGIPHRNFLNQGVAAVNDKLELYAPGDLVKKFSDADITNQQFIEGCVVIADDNRVSVSLTGS